MTELRNKNLIRKILSQKPLILLFVSVLNNFDFNYLSLKYFSFNFSYILIFYYSLKKSESLGYIYIFIAGLFNDVVVGTPLGLSSLMYLILCGAAAYLRNITLRPSLVNDCIFFLITILIINSLLFITLNYLMAIDKKYVDQIINIIFTFLLYSLFSNLFDFFENYFVLLKTFKKGPIAKNIQTINRRMFIIGAAKIIVFTGIIARLFSLQITENKKYLTLSDKNRLREWRLPPVRGEFLDYFGNIIAGNLEVYQLHVIPEEVEDFKYLMLRLKKILGLSINELNKIIKKKNKQKSWETLIVSKNLTWEQFTKVNFFLHDLTGAKPVLSVSRNYPFSDNYTHVLGYVSEASEKDLLDNEMIKNTHVPGLKVGKTGLEKTFENELIGTNGIQRYEVNAYGKRISQLDYTDGLNGKTIKLTIDTEIQKLCSELLKDVAGSISVMEIYTGEIVAMQSSPSFDPNLFLFGINQDDWQLIRNNPLKPLVNKTLSGLYSPGSTFKPIVALSALENEIIDENFKVNCTGKIEMYGQTYHCWKKKGHGVVNLKNAMKQSCDTYFYEIARKLGVDRLKETSIKIWSW